MEKEENIHVSNITSNSTSDYIFELKKEKCEISTVEILQFARQRWGRKKTRPLMSCVDVSLQGSAVMFVMICTIYIADKCYSLNVF